MKVSVIVTAYNIEQYIGRCLKSILTQSFQDIEVVVVNDGSTDNTEEIINSISKGDSRVKVINKKNSGIIEARKSGFNSSNGEYILFIDGDDWIEDECLMKMYLKAKEGDYDIIISNAFWSYDNKKIPHSMFSLKDEEENKLLTNILLSKIPPAMWGKLVKRNFIIYKKIEFPSNINYAEDLATVSTWFMNNPKIGFLKENLYNYYQREGSITKVESTNILQVDDAREFIKQQLEKNQIFEEYRDEFNYMEYKQIYIYRFLGNNIFHLNRKKVYKDFKVKNISIKKNRYIKSEFDNYSKSFKLRVKFYYINYYLGCLYDSIRNFTMTLIK